jgi:hypothetical protein
MKPHEFLASVRAKTRARAAAPPAAQAPAAAPVICDDGDSVPLDPAWVAEQERAEAAAARQNELDIGDNEFALAAWLVQVDQASHDPNGGSPSRRIAHIVSLGSASGLTDGQLEALQRLQARTNAARDVLSTAERNHTRRAGGQPWSVR